MSKKKHSADVPAKQIRVSSDEEMLILKYREKKVLLEEECVKSGIDLKSVKHFWYKSEMFSIFAKPNAKSINDLKDSLIKEMSQYSPKYPTIRRNKSKEKHMLVIDPADIHVGKLGSKTETGEVVNNEIIIRDVKAGIQGVLDKSNGFSIDKILFIGGNDVLHIDTPKRTTTSGTPQDTDGMWYDNFQIAKDLYVSVLEQLLPVADIHYIHNPSNHDFVHGYMLSDVVKTWFRKSSNITFDTDMRHRKAFKYGSNFIGTTHGDGARQDNLPLLFAHEFSKEWHETKHRYIYGHHLHHKTSKDYVGITYETTRSPTGSDGWHHRNGYQHATRAVEAYVHHIDNGQVARLTHILT